MLLRCTFLVLMAALLVDGKRLGNEVCASFFHHCAKNENLVSSRNSNVVAPARRQRIESANIVSATLTLSIKTMSDFALTVLWPQHSQSSENDDKGVYRSCSSSTRASLAIRPFLSCGIVRLREPIIQSAAREGSQTFRWCMVSTDETPTYFSRAS